MSIPTRQRGLILSTVINFLTKMRTRSGFIQFGLVMIFFVAFLIFISHRNLQIYPTPKHAKYTEPVQDDNSIYNFSSYATLKNVIKHLKMLVEFDVIDYVFPANIKLENLMMVSGGQPVRSVIISTWRSGSTFLGDVLNAVPGNFYHYEPLLDYGIVQIRGPPLAESAVSNLKKLLKCEYKDLRNYLQFGKSHVYLFMHNTRLWSQCDVYPQYCWNATFLSDFCKLFPFQSMKVVRLRLRLAEELLRDKSLNVKVVLLVRDPRGILQSRKHRDWCPGAPDCDQPNLLCADMVSDYSAAVNLQKIYPNRFRAIRYEDLSLDPYKNVQELFKFFGLHYHERVIDFLNSHTKLNVGGVSSTFRNSKHAPLHWRMDLNYSEVQYIEENCEQAMRLWGYMKARNETHLKDFNPITSYELS